jgi:hypothetical protein
MKSGNDENELNETTGETADQENSGATYIGGEASAGGGEDEAIDESIVVSEPRQGVSRGTMAMFAILILGAAGLYVMYRQTGPKAANAAVTKETAAAKKTINTFLSGGDTSIKTMEALIKNTEKVVQQFLAYPTVRQIPLTDLRTNPFRQHLEEKKPVNTSEMDEKKRREEERLAVYKAVQGLQLQSIMYSDTRTACMINNTLYREGQQVEGFTIEKISPTVVNVRNGSYRFELRMQK